MIPLWLSYLPATLAPCPGLVRAVVGLVGLGAFGVTWGGMMWVWEVLDR